MMIIRQNPLQLVVELNIQHAFSAGNMFCAPVQERDLKWHNSSLSKPINVPYNGYTSWNNFDIET